MHATLAEEDRTIVIEGVSWDTYMQMDELLEGVRANEWCNQQLELMSPISRYHELATSAP